MTNKEYKTISEAIEKGKEDINMSFERFTENLREGIIDNLSLENEKKLQDYFISMREWGGIPITKDNCEDLFEQFIEGISLKEINDILYNENI